MRIGSDVAVSLCSICKTVQLVEVTGDYAGAAFLNAVCKVDLNCGGMLVPFTFSRESIARMLVDDEVEGGNYGAN